MTKDHKAFGVHPTIPFRLLDKKDMAQLLGCTVRTVDRMVAARTIPFLKVPTGTNGMTKTKVRFDSRDIEKWIDQMRQGPFDPEEQIWKRLSGGKR